MIRSGTNFVWQIPMSSPHRGVRRRESSCKSSHSVVNAAHELPSYPLAYSVMVIPLSISRWLQFNHKSVPSAVVFLSEIMFNLSGAVNVLLFLIVRPHLLLFTPPEELVDWEPEVELANPRTSPSLRLFSDVYTHSPQPMEAELKNDD
jgi:hypothetical protein